MLKVFEKMKNIGVKKISLFLHYILASVASLIMLVFLVIGTTSPKLFDIFQLTRIYKIILIYCFVVVAIITVVSIYEKITETTVEKIRHGQKAKFDFFAFFIGFCMIMTFALMVNCCVSMYHHTLTEIERQMHQYMISVFAGMFSIEGISGVIYNIFKKRYAKTDESNESNTNNEIIANYNEKAQEEPTDFKEVEQQ